MSDHTFLFIDATGPCRDDCTGKSDGGNIHFKFFPDLGWDGWSVPQPHCVCDFAVENKFEVLIFPLLLQMTAP